MKNKKLIIIGAVVLIIVILVGSVIGGYNSLVEKQGEVEGKQAEIQTQLQRRSDLISNLVATVQGYADYEGSTLTAVTEARNSVANAKDVSEMAKANEQLDSAFSVWVNAVKEAYPDLKANQNFIALQDEIAGTENRIARARDQYNENAKEYNIQIRKFPKSIITGIFGFEKADLFEAAAGSETAPTVSFK